jgi:hypothetical protein
MTFCPEARLPLAPGARDLGPWTLQAASTKRELENDHRPSVPDFWISTRVEGERVNVIGRSGIATIGRAVER